MLLSSIYNTFLCVSNKISITKVIDEFHWVGHHIGKKNRNLNCFQRGHCFNPVTRFNCHLLQVCCQGDMKSDNMYLTPVHIKLEEC